MENVLDLINWYKKNFRDLPWRSTNDPYKIWLSEIILQQTQVVQGLSYYHRFITEYPTVSLLAAASEDQVLRLWQGLGYYSRARNLHKTAKIIFTDYQGIFPNEKTDLLKLPGIGDYTASAIASFAFNKAHPAIDGNVFRVISRYYDIELPIDESATKKVFLDILQPMIEQTSPALFNNAMMELGATICKTDKPDCQICPLYIDCQSRIKNTIPLRPVKSKKVKKEIDTLIIC
jgi:A/G-specific adenine glycosylase